MLEQIFTKKFLRKCRKNAIIVLSLIKYACLIFGTPLMFVFASGVDAPDPYGTNATIGCFICVGMVAAAMLIEMFVVKFLVKDNEHIQCIWDFNWYGLKSLDNWKEYQEYLEECAAEKRRREIKFKQIMNVANTVNTKPVVDRSNVIQFTGRKPINMTASNTRYSKMM